MLPGTVLQEAFAAAERITVSSGQVARCARCAVLGPVAPVRDVISKNFTDFVGWSDPCGSGLCEVCAWGLGEPSLRAVPHVIGRGRCEPTTASRIRAELVSGELGPDVAVVVPLRPGRKHLLPKARWGCATTDDLTMRWDVEDARRLRAVVQLRSWGFSSADLTAPAAPFVRLRRVDASSWKTAIDLWETLATWRQDRRPWMSLALKISSEENR